MEKIELVPIDLRGLQVRLGKFVYSSKLKVLPHVYEQIVKKLAEPRKPRIPKLPDSHRLKKLGVY